VDVRVRRAERAEVDVRGADEHDRAVAPVRRHAAEEPQVDALVEEPDDDDRRRTEPRDLGRDGRRRVERPCEMRVVDAVGRRVRVRVYPR